MDTMYTFDKCHFMYIYNVSARWGPRLSQLTGFHPSLIYLPQVL